VSGSAFDDVRFPLPVGPGASGGAMWRTDVVILASGAEVRNARWAGSRRRWDIASAVCSTRDLALLAAFFEARMGRLRGFRFRDPADHSSAMPGQAPGHQDQSIGTGDGATDTFQLGKAYGGLVKPVTKPVEGTVGIAVDGVPQVSGWAVDCLSGAVTFDTPPGPGAALTAGFEFDWPVRFDTDRLDITHELIGAGRAVSVPIIEIR